MHSYATYFDSNYLPRALSLFDSLKKNGDSSDLFALLLDKKAEEFFETSDLGINTISLEEIETRFPELLAVKKLRSKMEYIFTLTPWLLKFVAEKTKAEQVIYLDSDLYFFSDPQIVVDEMAASDIGIIEHKYPKLLEKSLAKYGKFNVGWVGIRKSANGLACLDWWAGECLKWCYDKPEEGKYADQGYLDEFPKRFRGVHVLQNKGFNLAPWNAHGVSVRQISGSPHLDATGEKLVFFHFHGLKRFGRRFVTAHLNYFGKAHSTLISELYEPYAQSLIMNELKLSKTGIKAGAPNLRGNGLRRLGMQIQRSIFALVSILIGNAFTLKTQAKEIK